MDPFDPVLVSGDAEDEWKLLFATCDSEGFGEVDIGDFERVIHRLEEQQQRQQRRHDGGEGGAPRGGASPPPTSLSPDRITLLKSREEGSRIPAVINMCHFGQLPTKFC